MATQKGRNWSSGDIVTAANLSSVERGVSAVSSLYEPTTWANGDTVTAAALNNIEQGIVNADGGSQSWVTLCEEEVTTTETEDGNQTHLSYSQLISADTIRVTFDGNEYMCENVSPVEEVYAYGGATQTGSDFSEYPFVIISGTRPKAGVVNQIVTETPGTYTVKIEALQESGSSDFSTAQVTITGGEEGIGCISLPILYNNIVIGTPVPNGAYTVLLYNGVCGAYNVQDVSVVVTGSASVSGSIITITGDCTITISSGSDPIR